MPVWKVTGILVFCFTDIGTSIEEIKPSPALKKSTSLESLKAAYQDPDHATEPSKDPVDSQGRPCGSNNSFRAAVDRSYEKNLDVDETPLNGMLSVWVILIIKNILSMIHVFAKCYAIYLT